MKYKKLIYWIFGILLFIYGTDLVWGQTSLRASTKVEIINDDNFKKKIAKGFVLVKFTATYQRKDLDSRLFDGIKGFEGCVIYKIDQSNVKGIVKKLRIRNYPSIVLYYNGSKKEVWKANMDSIIEIESKDIKKAINDVLAEDVF